MNIKLSGFEVPARVNELGSQKTEGHQDDDGQLFLPGPLHVRAKFSIYGEATCWVVSYNHGETAECAGLFHG